MKRLINLILPLLLVSSTALRADCGDDLDLAVQEMNGLYDTGPCAGCQDCVFNSVSSSMIGWGIGLAVGIAIITGFVHNSRSSTTTTTTTPTQ